MSSFAPRLRAPSAEKPRSAGAGKRTAVAPVHRALDDRSAGRPLEPALRFALELGFASPLDDVRIHADGRADDLARGLDAEAFTRGRDVYFRAGRFDPRLSRADPLLAHEIAHTIQQRGESGSTTLGERGDAHEVDATDAARALTRGEIARPRARGRPPRIQRFVGTEHERLGNVSAVADIDLGHGVHLSWGQIVALAGDYYATVEDLLEDTRTPPGRVRIRAALEDYGSPAVAATPLPAATAADRAAAGSRLVVLALRNVPHFALGGDAHATWLDHHSRAISAAVSAGLAHDLPALDGAYLLEAFGEHFLTDSFAAGHIRTPRRDIIDWYVGTFAPRVFDHLVATLRERAVDAVYDQIPAGYRVGAILVSPLAGPVAIRAAIRSNIQGRIDRGIIAAGGRAKVIELIGLGLAGAVSGAMHDVENVRGLRVSSVENPAGWTSYGDANLDKIAPGATTPENRIQAENAVLAAKQDIDDAFQIAWAEGARKRSAPAPTALPSTVFFGFDHFDLTPAARGEVQGAALHMIYNPEVELDLVGHTDRVGNDAYNDRLSFQRAQTVNDLLVTEGVAPHRLTVGFRGERDPVTTDPRQAWRNRRVAFTWRSSLLTTASHDIALEHVQDAVRRRIGPPYRAERFLPTPVVGANVTLPDWHWGSMPRTMQTDVATWATSHLTAPITSALLRPELDPTPVTVAGQTITIEPRPIATTLATELLADPIRFLNDALGETAGP